MALDAALTTDLRVIRTGLIVFATVAAMAAAMVPIAAIAALS